MEIRMIQETTHQQRVERARRPNPVRATRAPLVVYRCRSCSAELGRTHLGWCDTTAVTYIAEVR